MRCPDDQTALEPSRGRGSRCPRCRGLLLSAGELELLSPGVGERLVVEGDLTSGAFTRNRLCPDCGAVMAPWRIGEMLSWLHRCPSCESYWAASLEQRTLQRVGHAAVKRKVYDDLSAPEKRELARDLSASMEIDRSLSPLHSVLAWLGFPVITGIEGQETPWLTWSLCVVLVITGNLGMTFDLAYVVGEGSFLTAFAANFVHFGWLHLLGNLYFLFVFGDGLERRLPRWLYALAFVFGGPVTILAEAQVAEVGAMIAGASGAVAVVMGACIVMQPRAKVAVRLIFTIVRLPMLGFGAFELGFQTLMLLWGVPGIAWTAHLTGLVLGVAVGLLATFTGLAEE